MSSPQARSGLALGQRAFKAMTVPTCVACGTFPVLAGPLSAAGLFGAAQALHSLVPVFATLNLAILWLSYRQHRKHLALSAAATGVLLIFMHFAGHSVFHFPVSVEVALIWIGSALLAAGVLIDWHAQRRPGVQFEARRVEAQSP